MKSEVPIPPPGDVLPVYPVFDAAKVAAMAEKRLQLLQLDPDESEHGLRYTDHHIAVLLSHPLTDSETLLSAEGASFYHELRKRNRKNFGIDGDVTPLRKVWYPQGLQPTCVPWTYASVLATQLMPVDSGVIAGLVNKANKENRGISGKALIRESGKSLPQLSVKSVLDGATDDFAYAAHIKRTLDNGGVIMDSVTSAYWNSVPAKDEALHQVGIVGYSTENGAMNVDVVDSSTGYVSVPVEFLFQVRENKMITFQTRLPSESYHPANLVRRFLFG